MVEFDAKITPGDLYDFQLAYVYSKVSTLLISAFAAMCVIVGFNSKQPIFVIGGFALLLYLPWTLFIKSRQQILANPVFKNSIHYCLDERGITISQGEGEETLEWDMVLKATSTSRSILVYTSAVNATIFPKNQLGDQKAAVIEMISRYVPPKKVKIRQ